jgi:hypothetical protein
VKGLSKLCLLLTLLVSALAAQALGAPHPCAERARNQAEQLVALHLGVGGRDTSQEQITIDSQVRSLPPVVNPAYNKQRLDALEVWGYKGKGEFRIRLLYIRGDTSECLPVGREIINWARY